MPNGVFFLNTGLEVYEPQPMNLGLDSSSEDLYRLEKDDPFYGKLALFDRYQLHYLHPQRFDLYNMLSFLKPLKETYQDALMDSKKTTYFESDQPFFIGYVSEKSKTKRLMVLSNLNPYGDTYLNLSLDKVLKSPSKNPKLLFSTHESPRDFTQITGHTLDLHLGAGEVKIIEL
jgi:hypothetical protein